jgi:hypothetical protein
MKQGLALHEKDWCCEYVDSFKLTREQRKTFKERCKRQGVEPDYMTEFLFKEELIEEQLLAQKVANERAARSALLQDDEFLGFCKAVVDDFAALDAKLSELGKRVKEYGSDRERLERLEKQVADAVLKNYSQADVIKAVLKNRISDLEAVVAKLQEQQSSLTKETEAFPFRYRGVWTATEDYRLNDFCTYRGAMWWCAASCPGSPDATPPGKSVHWTLAVKSGRDGKDAR